MNRIITIITVLFLISITTQPVQAQTNQDSLLDPTSQSFQVKLTELQLQNPHLGPNHDLVYPGDVLIFEDSTEHVIQEGQYESILLLDYLRNNNLNPDRLVSIVRNDTTVSQENSFPWYIWLPAWLSTLALIIVAANMSNLSNLFGPVNVQHHYHNQNDPEEEAEERSNIDEDDLLLLLLLSDFTRGSTKGSSDAPVVYIEGNGNNTVNIGSGEANSNSTESEG